MPRHYPFSAVVGCEPDALDDMGLALVLTTISPEIGGVLVRGEKGTAKSTAVRALVAVLPPIDVYAGDRFSVDPHDPGSESPDGPFAETTAVEARAVRLVELPVGATEDRVMGSLHLESALSRGRVEYEPGLLARAHRGILYVDEVNLLHDHLVDLLLDSAAMGRATVERDGVSMEHPSRFVLIGTMNPEEGELRPQLLDRFGLAVEVTAPREPALRAEVVRRRMAYDADPESLAARYAGSEQDLTARIEGARERLGKVALPQSALLRIAQVCAAFEVDGLRADIVTARAAVAHAAWEGRDEVTRADIRRAAVLALPHRRRRKPFDAPGLDADLLDQLLGDDEPEPDPPQGLSEEEPRAPQHGQSPDPGPGEGSPDAGPDDGGPDRPAAPPEPTGFPAGATAPATTDGRSSTDAASEPYRARLLTVRGPGEGAPGRRSRALAADGRRVGARRPDGEVGSLHLVETLRAAAGRRPERRPSGEPVLTAVDLRTAVREGREANLVLFCVDASGSMAARKRMSQVKTAVLSLLLDAYRRRDKVGLVTFRGGSAEVVLPPTRSVEVAARRLAELPAGGRTPLAEGLLEAAAVVSRERIREPRLRPLLVVVTDGRATSGPDAVRRSLRAADHVHELGIACVVVDGEAGPLRLGLAADLARQLGAEHVLVAEVSAEALGAVTRRGRGVA
ncbi:MAG TPA: VWA domain-containing protein [Nocardioides sp.]|uniref:VWA domain-containing protein n=1 Tax=Nocardioides sp. TaxID=35761 RepID=UPI002E31D79C|nr:VWA domain-containing protein [Nocardioides sp.]HEX3931095.1 VWA domain-containing protein [Nocardioides sp.]